MLYKKRWSDGLHDDFDHLDEFEHRFYCFGGDGGGNSGGGSSSSSSQNQSATAQEPVRGGRTAPAPTRQETLDMVNAAARQSLDAKAAAESLASPNKPSAGTGAGLSITEMFPDAVVSPSRAPSMPSAVDSVSFAQPEERGIGSLPDFSNLSMSAPVTAEQAYQQAVAPSLTVQSLADKIGVPSSVNIGGYNVGFGSTPGTQGLAGPTVNVGPGTLGLGTNRAGDAIGLGFNMKFADGGIVSLRKR